MAALLTSPNRQGQQVSAFRHCGRSHGTAKLRDPARRMAGASVVRVRLAALTFSGRTVHRKASLGELGKEPGSFCTTWFLIGQINELSEILGNSKKLDLPLSPQIPSSQLTRSQALRSGSPGSSPAGASHSPHAWPLPSNGPRL